MIEILLWGGIALIVYTFFGYPVLIRLWSTMRPWPVKPGGDRPRVAIIVVMHNEAARAKAKIETCLAQDYPADRMRVVVACDGSTDSTHDVVRAYGGRGVTLLPFAERRGKAACLNDAVAACDEDILVFTDARQMLNREAVSCLVETLADPAVGAVSGELVFEVEGASSFGQGVDAYWRYEKFIRRSEAAVHSVPGVTGALYAVRRSAYRPISARTILDDVAIPMQVVMQGLRVVFDGRAQAVDKPSTDAQQERVRKVRTLAGNFQLVSMYPSLMLPWRNPIFVQFVSHKLLRLLAPWAMLAVLLGNVALAPGSSFYGALLVLQLAIYSLPVLGWCVPRANAWRPVRLAHAFFTLNWFAVLGLFEFLRNRNPQLWHVKPAAAPDRSRS